MASHYGEAGRRNLGLFLRKDDPVRHERLAAIGKNGTQIRLQKRMTFYFVYLSDWKTKFLPIIKSLSLFVT